MPGVTCAGMSNPLAPALPSRSRRWISACTFFSRSLIRADALLAALPPRYAEVLHDMLNRLESSALFTDESCSFSQQDLLAHVQLWLDKATQQLAQA